MQLHYTVMCPIKNTNKCLFRDYYADNKDVTINQNFTIQNGNTICDITIDNAPDDSADICFDLIPKPCVNCLHINNHLGR